MLHRLPRGAPARPRDRPRARSASPSASADASASASPIPDDPLAPARFAVDLFDVDESTIAPGSAATIEALGTTAAASPAPGSSGTAGGAATERPTTRDELWVPIVLIVLVVLCVEWALYHRDGFIRARRALAARLGRDTGGAA